MTPSLTVVAVPVLAEGFARRVSEAVPWRAVVWLIAVVPLRVVVWPIAVVLLRAVVWPIAVVLWPIAGAYRGGYYPYRGAAVGAAAVGAAAVGAAAYGAYGYGYNNGCYRDAWGRWVCQQY